MTFRGLKRGVYLLEGLNGLATSLYFNYLFFYLRDRFGFGQAGNLAFSAAMGFVYIWASLYAGKFAQKRGYFVSLKLGFSVVIVALLAAAITPTVWAQFVFMLVWTIGVCFTWPVFEALTAEHETSQTLPGRIGFYNLVWSGTQAFAYFSGGAIIEWLGYKSIFYIPIAIHLIQLFITRKLSFGSGNSGRVARGLHADFANFPGAPNETGPVRYEASAQLNKRFLRMAWIANPFAYIAMNTIIPLLPSLAAQLQLTPKLAGFFGSIWMFSRLASFGLLWKWTAWHYRFRWLLGAYLLMIATFTSFLLLRNFTLLIVIQIAFGWATGLIYYSSLFYSMDATDTKGEHGGIHEAAIGAGIFGGPALAATAAYLAPAAANASVFTVSTVLVCGLAGLLFLRKS